VRSALERRKEILSVLNIRRQDTVSNLAFEFCVSVRTILRDIELLCIDYPIYTVQGKGGGVYMLDGCKAGRKYMSEAQEELL
jgi:predicted DNA-binding transcriptional regulator YafY